MGIAKKMYLEDMTEGQRIGIIKGFAKKALESMENGEGYKAGQYIRMVNHVCNRLSSQTLECQDTDLLNSIVWMEEK